MVGKPTYEELEKRIQKLKQAELEHKRIEEDLRKSEEKYRRLTENARDMIYRQSLPDGKYEYVNQASFEIMGYSPEEICNYPMHIRETIHPDWKDYLEEQWEKLKKGEIPPFYEFQIVHKSGDVKWIHQRNVLIFDNNGHPVATEGIATDITDRKRTEETLRENEERLALSLSVSTSGIWDLNLKTGDMYLDKEFLKLLGYAKGDLTETVDALRSIHHPDEWDEMWGAVNAHLKGETNIYINEHRLLMKCGDWKWILTQARVVHYDYDDVPERMIGVVTDISERRKAEKEKIDLQKQLQQSQKMEAVGTLAGGIAHDFNNILSIILGNTELAIDDVPESNPARHNLEEANAASLRAKDLVQQLLSFSRKSNQKQTIVNIGPIIKDCLKFLRSIIPANIEILRTFPDELCIISADPTQIHQVMLNLCTNAAHAMTENGGIMEVSLSVTEIGKAEVNQYAELDQGQYVKITVSDTGYGIAKEHIDRVFDPYFTTKKVGEGSGIGLSVVHGIVKRHNGAISVVSEYGKGATFDVFFPVVEKEPIFKKEIDTAIPTGNERILFVDDEKAIANMASQMLERLGYIVTTRTSSMDTLETFRTRPDNFDLIISDMSMPEITGDKLAKEFQQIRPDIPIILCTGFSERIDDEKAKSIGVRALVMKPIVKSELAKIIRKILD